MATGRPLAIPPRRVRLHRTNVQTTTRPSIVAPAPQPVLERDREIQAIEAALDRAGTRTGTAMVIEGEAGIGKSTLARHAADGATARGFRVLRAQASELERELPYGVVAELFQTLVRDQAGAAETWTQPGDQPMMNCVDEHPDGTLTALGAMGGRAQPQIHTQVLRQLLDVAVVREPCESPRNVTAERVEALPAEVDRERRPLVPLPVLVKHPERPRPFRERLDLQFPPVDAHASST